MRITKIQIMNYLGIGTFKLDRVGKINIVTGKNGIGKSSVLKAIQESFKSSGIDPNLVKIDSEKAEILVELDSRIQIERRITETTNDVKVVIDGQPVGSPVKYLKELVGPNQFNPVDFYLADKKERRTVLLNAIHFTLNKAELIKALGADVELVDIEKFDFSRHGIELLELLAKTIYDKRWEQGQHVTRLTKAIEQDKRDIPETVDGAKLAAFDQDAKLTELRQAEKLLEEYNGKLRLRDSLREQRQKAMNKIEETRALILRLEKQLDEAHIQMENDAAEAERILQQGIALKNEIEAFVEPDVDAIQGEIAEFQRNQQVAFKLQEIQKRVETLDAEKNLHTRLDEFHKRLVNDIPRTCLAKVKLPIDGLRFAGDQIFVNNVPLDHMSTSEQIVFAVRLAKQLAGKLKVINIDRFESLDPDARAAFETEAASDDFEYFMTQVTSGELDVQVKNPKPEVVGGGVRTGKAAAPGSAAAQPGLGF